MVERRVPVSLFQGDLEAARTTLRENSLLALEQQVAVLEWLRLGRAEQFFRGYAAAGSTNTRVQPHRVLMSLVQGLLETAPTYYVSPDMTAMIEHATDALGEHPDEGLVPTDLLTDRGFLYFDRPIPVRANSGRYEGRTAAVRAVAWQQDDVRVPAAGDGNTVAPGLTYFLYVDPEEAAKIYNEDNEAEAIEMARKVQPDLPEPIHVEFDRSDAAEMRMHAGPLVLFDHSGWAFGRAWKEGDVSADAADADGVFSSPETDGDGNLVVAPIVAGTRRLLLSTWKMLSQMIVQTTTERAGRPLRRRAGRVIPDPQDVIVIRLRREYDPAAKYEAETGEKIEGSWYSHRFLVRGHWKRQPYGPGRSKSKIIWIASHIRGPKDAPLVLKQKVYALEQ